MTDAATRHDIAVIGADPAGLTAGLYLGRYRRDVLIVHDDAHEAAIRAGVLRYCPICDGYEHRDSRIGAIGCDSDGAIEDSGIPGFFAAGDVIHGLDQISVAMGHGAMAATHAHNWLREQDQHSLQVRA